MANSSTDDDLIDVCQLDYEQRIFLCHQAVKQADLRQEFHRQNNEDPTCTGGQFKCPAIVISGRNGQNPLFLDCNFCLKNSSQPNTIVLFWEYWVLQYRGNGWHKCYKESWPSALIRGISKDFNKTN